MGEWYTPTENRSRFPWGEWQKEKQGQRPDWCRRNPGLRSDTGGTRTRNRRSFYSLRPPQRRRPVAGGPGCARSGWRRYWDQARGGGRYNEV